MDDLNGSQLTFWGKNGVAQGRCPDCLVSDFIGENDSACKNFKRSNYEVLECGTEKGIKYTNDCRGISLNNVSANKIYVPELPQFIPTVKRGSGYMLGESDITWVAITLADVVSPSKLTVAKNIRQRIGVSDQTKILLLNYASDFLIEKIWEHRHKILSQLSSVGVDLMTAIDYSVYWDQPHLERLVNVKRSLITFDMLQQFGAKVVPHIYWSGKEDIDRWADWLLTNQTVTSVSMYWGLFKKDSDWQKQIDYLTYFNQIIDRPIHQIISGPSTSYRVNQITKLLPNVTVTSGSPARLASNKHLLVSESHAPINVFPRVPFDENVTFFSDLMETKEESHQKLIQLTGFLGKKMSIISDGDEIIIKEQIQDSELPPHSSDINNLISKEVQHAKK